MILFSQSSILNSEKLKIYIKSSFESNKNSREGFTLISAQLFKIL